MAIVTASDGKQFDPDDLPLLIGWNEDGTVAWIEVRASNQAYRQIFSYSDGKCVAIGRWSPSS